MNKKNVRTTVILIIVVFVLTLIAYPILFSPTSLQPEVDATEVDIEGTPMAPLPDR